jgi:hypothetical protein
MITKGTVLGGVLLALALAFGVPLMEQAPAPVPVVEQRDANAGPPGSVG